MGSSLGVEKKLWCLIPLYSFSHTMQALLFFKLCSDKLAYPHTENLLISRLKDFEIKLREEQVKSAALFAEYKK